MKKLLVLALLLVAAPGCGLFGANVNEEFALRMKSNYEDCIPRLRAYYAADEDLIPKVKDSYINTLDTWKDLIDAAQPKKEE